MTTILKRNAIEVPVQQQHRQGTDSMLLALLLAIVIVLAFAGGVLYQASATNAQLARLQAERDNAYAQLEWVNESGLRTGYYTACNELTGHGEDYCYGKAGGK